MVHLVDVTPEIGEWELEVEESQKRFVANRLVMLARAYMFREYRTRAYWIYEDDKAVGMGLYYDCPERDSYDFCQIFIDKHYQKRGYGKKAVRLVLDEMKRDGKYNKVTVCYVEGNEVSRRLFEQFGFQEIEVDGDEIIMEMSF